MESTNYSLFEKFADVYENVWDQRDKRMDEYFIMRNPLTPILLCCGYAFVALCAGPRLMKNRQPFNIKSLVLVFNLVMIVVNAYLHIQGWKLCWTKYRLLCEPVDTSLTPRAMMITSACHLYLIVKFVDWADTLFFILRKKFTHVSFLHVYHHLCMPLNTWSVIRFLPGGHMTFPGQINTLIHVVMHTYYALSLLGSRFRKYLWWKKYITKLQIFQFVFGMLYLLPLLLPSCGIPKTFLITMIPQGFLFLFLFTDFYRQTYGKDKRNESKKKN